MRPSEKRIHHGDTEPRRKGGERKNNALANLLNESAGSLSRCDFEQCKSLYRDMEGLFGANAFFRRTSAGSVASVVNVLPFWLTAKCQLLIARYHLLVFRQCERLQRGFGDRIRKLQ